MKKSLLLGFPALMLMVVLPIIAQNPASQAQQNCDPSYPDFCIAPPPPDLDCADIGRQSFTVREPDPHHFDGDNDGIGCEPYR